MDTHFVGPAVNGHGAVPVTRGLRTAFGVTAAGSRVLLKTTGAAPATPLLVEMFKYDLTAFNGSSPVVSIVSTLLDGTDSTNELVIGDLSSGQAYKRKLITADRIYYALYTAATGSPTAGNSWSIARVCGMGFTE